MSTRKRSVSLLVLGIAAFTQLNAFSETRRIERFHVKQLSDIYYSEGAAVGDLNNDGNADVVYGPLWFEGPKFEKSHSIYEAKPQNREGYADHFFAWVYDFDADGWNDIFTVGFPGTPAYVYPNPGNTKDAGHWKKHQVFDSVSNESPQLIQLVGDERPELVCTRDGFFGYATIDWQKPFEAWKFVAISPQVADKRFGHGLGIGDINGDGRLDVIHASGWIEQPKELSSTKAWQSHDVAFSNAYGGAEMYAYDVDGDGDNDVITSLAAHDFGLAWYEQVRSESDVKFVRHDIMGSRPEHNPFGLVFSELHSVRLADIDGDGLQDIVTGKTYYSHHKASPMWDAGAVVYWFKLQRTDEGVKWLPYQIAPDTGVGRQLVVQDTDNDKDLDVVVGGMKGCFVIEHLPFNVEIDEWNDIQPKPYVPEPKQTGNGTVQLFEGEELPIVSVTNGSASPQGMGGFNADRWSNDSQLWWTGAGEGDKLELEFVVSDAGSYDVQATLTKAVDYGMVQLYLDGKKLGGPLDLFNAPEVVTTGLLQFGEHELKKGPHRLVLEIVGKNAAAVPAHMVGLDVLQLGKSKGSLPKDATGKLLNLDFEKGTLEDWTAEGDAFDLQPVRGDTVKARRGDMSSLHQGEFWVGTFEKSGDAVQGTLTSKPFVVDQPFASFLVGGGSQNDTRVELVDQATGKAFFRATGRVTENMRLVVADLKEQQGKQIFVRVVDGSTGGWGHINFDAFQLHATQPGPISAPDVPLVADEYPFKGVSAKEAAAAMKVPDGFRVIPSAAEPDVLQPIAMALDDRGRVWIVEAYTYPIRAAEGQGKDRILIFEDTDGDGSLDKRKVFTEGLNLVSGLEVGFGGVWVGAAPYLMFIPDKNQDDVPDAEPQILLDGWGYQDTHETLNAFIWGPDGWLYGCHGVFTHSNVGKPGAPESERQRINAGVWRYHPTRHVFEVFSHGTSNPWGVDFNDRGQAFITACVIPHLYHMIQGGRYERQAGQHFNPYTYDDIKTIADHRHYLGANPHGGNGRSDAAGGGHAHAGAMIYLGDAWPKSYRDQLFMNNIHGQRLNVDILNPQGSGYVGSHGPDFLLTGDQASQILNLRYGPDGQAWMIDWYDMQACHLTDPGKHDRSNGRIYKIVYGDLKNVQVDLRKASDLELVEYQLHSNDWYVRHSRRLLQERALTGKLSGAAVDRLKKIAIENSDETRRLRALWVLSATDRLDADTSGKLLKDKSPYVRGWTIQASLQSSKPLATVSANQLAAIAEKEASPVVRLYLASAAQQTPASQRWELLSALVKHAEDANDHNLPLMIWYATEPVVELDPDRAIKLGLSASKTLPLIRDSILKRIGAIANEAALATLVRGLGDANEDGVQLAFLDAIRTSLAGQRRANPPKEWTAVAAKLAASGNPDVKLQGQALGVTFGDESALAAVRKLVESAQQPEAARREALSSLLGAKDPKLAPVLQKLVDDPQLRTAAIAGLAQYADTKTADVLLKVYSDLSQSDKRAALSTLASRVEFAIRMLQSIEEKKIPASDLSADLVRQLQYLKSDQVQKLLESTWGTARETPAEKAKLIEEYKALVASTKEPKVDLSLGRAVFAKTCQQCHVLFGTGGKVGPELTGSNRANLDYLLSNIVDPSAVMAKEYQPTIVLTNEGRVVTGVVKAEDAKAITIQTADAVEVIPLDEIEERKLSPKSMMPEDQLRPFSSHEVRSLLAYLANDRQVPVLATEATVNLFFNGKDLTGWTGAPELWRVENGELIGKTDGLKHNEFLVSDLLLSDFRLKLEVKLVEDAGNSGVQFRSQPTAEGVKGYQADIGEGWWGKLYEEEGRALLWEKSGEEHVKKGDWNTYEIVAEGANIQTYINGKLCVDLKDPQGAKRGIVAVQLHSGGPTEVRFRNFQLEVLNSPK